MGRLFLFCATLLYLPTLYAVDIVGHRGAAGLSPENTLASYQAALGIGVHVIDIDVVLSADGEVMVSHDGFLNPEFTRDSDGVWLTDPLAISHIHSKDLRAYNVGSSLPTSEYALAFPLQRQLAHEAIPTLKEVIQFAKKQTGNCIRYQIEIKTDPSPDAMSPNPLDIVPAVLAVLRDEGVTQLTQIHSFDWRNLSLISNLDKDISLSFLTDFRPDDPWTPGLWTDGQPIKSIQETPKIIVERGGKIWCPHYSTLTPELVEISHAYGLQVQPWTVDEAEEMVHLVQMGVDGIITNRPDILRGVLASYQSIKSVCPL